MKITKWGSKSQSREAGALPSLQPPTTVGRRSAISPSAPAESPSAEADAARNLQGVADAAAGSEGTTLEGPDATPRAERYPGKVTRIPSSTNGNGVHTDDVRVLVVDDEDAISDLVATTLRYEGFDVEVAASGRSAISAVSSYRPTVLLLDVMLGDIDGFEVIRRLRDNGENVPVLFLTAADTPEDRVRGLMLGGDDYICKPFSLAELVARVRVALRHAGRKEATPRLVLANLVMNLDTLEVRRGDRTIDLTPTEFKLLRYLLENANRVLSKNQIVENVWEYDYDGDANIVETYISYLRKKVDFEAPALLQTVRGFGYSLRTPRESSS